MKALANALPQALENRRVQISGQVTEAAQTHLQVTGLSSFAKLGDYIGIETASGTELGEVVRAGLETVIVKPFGMTLRAGSGTKATLASPPVLRPHSTWKGRLIDALGRKADQGAPLMTGNYAVPFDARPTPPLKRGRVDSHLRTGVRAVDIFTPLCFGQRVGVFAGSGVGKSTLLAMLTRAGGFDSVVIGLIGERGREVREFVEDVLGPHLDKAVIVVSTSDESAMMRRQAPKTAMAVAEFFRDSGENVLLVVDSLTRYAHAARDVALAAGEPPVWRGYPPSVFTDLPKLLERAGPGEEGGGSITGIFSILVDGDDHNDPVADTLRGTLDGHIVLDRAIAEQGRYPAIDVLASISRLAPHAWLPDQRALVLELKAQIARFEDTKDLRQLGGYRHGADTDVDVAVALVPKIYRALTQSPADPVSEDAFAELAQALAS